MVKRTVFYRIGYEQRGLNILISDVIKAGKGHRRAGRSQWNEFIEGYEDKAAELALEMS